MIRWIAQTIALAFLLNGTAGLACAESLDSVEQGRQALESLGWLDWYDDETETVKPVFVEDTDGASSDSKNRLDGYESTATTKTTSSLDLAAILEAIGWTTVCVLGVLFVVAVVSVLLSVQRSRRLASGHGSEAVEELSETAERLERLPIDVKRPTSNLLDEARALMEAGKYNDAIVYLFSHQLVQLDKHQFLRLARGKTNRQYLRELRQATDLRDILRGTVRVFEDAFFGNHLISRERFADCWDELDRFQSALVGNNASNGVR